MTVSSPQRPTANGTANEWSTGGLYTAIDDAVTEPTVPTAGAGEEIYAEDKGDQSDDEEYVMNDLPTVAGGTATNVRLWMYVVAADSGIYQVNIEVDGTWQTSQTQGGTGWTSYDFTISQALDSAVSLGIRFTANISIAEGEVGDKVTCAYCLTTHDDGGDANIPVPLAVVLASHPQENENDSGEF